MTADDYLQLGVAVSKAQTIEFALYGLLTHLKKDPKIVKDKRLLKLTPREFLSTNPESKTLRMMTLGQLSEVLPNGFGIDPDFIQDYVSRRNLLVHDFMREINPKYASIEVIEPKSFLKKFITDSDELQNILLGLLYVIMDQIAEKNDLSNRKPSGDDVDKAKAAFYSHVIRHKG